MCFLQTHIPASSSTFDTLDVNLMETSELPLKCDVLSRCIDIKMNVRKETEHRVCLMQA